MKKVILVNLALLVGGLVRAMTGADRYWLERLQASAVMEACRAANGGYIDLGGNINFEPAADFYDPFHTTPSGSRKIAAFLYPAFKSVP